MMKWGIFLEGTNSGDSIRSCRLPLFKKNCLPFACSHFISILFLYICTGHKIRFPPYVQSQAIVSSLQSISYFSSFDDYTFSIWSYIKKKNEKNIPNIRFPHRLVTKFFIVSRSTYLPVSSSHGAPKWPRRQPPQPPPVEETREPHLSIGQEANREGRSDPLRCPQQRLLHPVLQTPHFLRRPGFCDPAGWVQVP